MLANAYDDHFALPILDTAHYTFENKEYIGVPSNEIKRCRVHYALVSFLEDAQQSLNYKRSMCNNLYKSYQLKTHLNSLFPTPLQWPLKIFSTPMANSQYWLTLIHHLILEEQTLFLARTQKEHQSLGLLHSPTCEDVLYICLMEIITQEIRTLTRKPHVLSRHTPQPLGQSGSIQ